MENPFIGIVIVNYNGEKFQNDCIESILKCSYKNIKIIVVDNGSKDKSMELLKNICDERIVTIFNNDNLGVAEGNNVGIKKSIELGMDYTMLLNNDTVVDKDFMQELLKMTNEYQVVVPKIYFYGTNNIWYGGGVFVWRKGESKHLNYKLVDEGITYNKEYDYSPTCCMLIRNDVFEKIGMMDANYFLYFDDTDFCVRLLDNNIRIGFAQNAIIYHKVSLSTGGSESKLSIYYYNRNKLYFCKKHKKHMSVVTTLYNWLSLRVKYLLGVLKGNNRKYIKKAIKDYKKNRMGRCDTL